MKKFDLKKAILENKATFFSSLNEDKTEVNSPEELLRKIIRKNSNFKWLKNELPKEFSYNDIKTALKDAGYSKIYDEFIILNEGQHSWMTQDTGKQIGSERENTIDVYMFDNKGNKWYEPNYEGYGEFGGKDYYELLDQMNGGSGDRSRGINLAFDKIKTDGEILYPALVTKSNYDWKSHDFTKEAEDDPNQSWLPYEEYSYRDYHDEELEEGDIKEKNNTNIYKVAEKFANYMSKKEGKKFTVNTDSVDEYSFDLDLDGKEYEGGSYLLKGDNIVNVAMPGNPSYAKINQFLEEGEAAYEYEKGKEAGEKIEKKKMKMSELRAKIKEMIIAEMDLDVTDETSGYDFLAELEEILEAEEKEEKDKKETADIEAADDVAVGDEEITTDTEVAEVDPNVKAVQDALTQAQTAAQQLGDKKLINQIGNTITFFTRAHVVEKPGGAIN